MTEKELKASVKAPTGGYFLYGDEDYLKEHYAAAIRRAVITDEAFADFNEIVLNDENFSAAALEDAVSRVPMMAEKKLIRVSLTSYDALPEREKKVLAEIFASLPDDTVLTFVVAPGGFDAGTAKRPSAAYRALSSVIAVTELPLCAPLPLMRWLARHFAEHGLSADEASLSRMIDLCGRSMHRLSLEAEKVAARACGAGLSAVSVRLVESTVSRTEEEDAFRLANSILDDATETSLDSLRMAKDRSESPIRLLAAVTAVFCDMAAVAHLVEEGATRREIASATKMHEYRVGLYMKAVAGIACEKLDAAVSMCADADAQMKSSPLGYVILERLICSVRLR